MPYSPGKWVSFEYKPHHHSSYGGVAKCEANGKIISILDNFYIIQSTDGRFFCVPIDSNPRLLNISIPKYSIGDNILVEVESCQQNAVVTDVSNNEDCLMYDVKILDTSKKIVIMEHDILKKIYIQKPKFSIGQYIGVIISSTNSIHSATIINVMPDFDNVNYSVKMNCHHDTTVVPESDLISSTCSKHLLCIYCYHDSDMTQKEKELNFLKSEERKLLLKLKMIRKKQATITTV